ncbi:MAG: hypothetical protein ACK5KP_02695, partial [Paludibacteraceae bacterium]
MKKLYFIAISLLAFSFAFISCEEKVSTEDHSKISGTVENGSSLNSPSDSVYVYMEDGFDTPYAKSALKSGAFSIQLDTPSAGQLYSMDMAWQIDESKITISDKSAKIAAIYFALVQSGEQKNLFLGSYAYTPSGVSATVATYVYC